MADEADRGAARSEADGMHVDANMRSGRDTEIIEKISRPKPGGAKTRAGMGRPKGAKNRVPLDVKRLCEDAVAGAGGLAWLTRKIRKSDRIAATVLTLLGRQIPNKSELDAPDIAKLAAGLVGKSDEEVERIRRAIGEESKRA